MRTTQTQLPDSPALDRFAFAENEPGNGSSGGKPGPSGGGGGGQKPNPNNLRPARGLFGVVSILTIALVLFLILTTLGQGAMPLSWADFRAQTVSNQVTDIRVSDDGITGISTGVPTRQGTPTKVIVKISPSQQDFFLKELNQITDGKFTPEQRGIWTQLLISMLPILLIIAIIWFFIARGLRNAGGGAGGMLGSFGKSRHRTLTKEMTGITFNDVAGIDEAKDEVTEIIEFLKNPKRFMKLGGRIPRGVLLIGEPGCGKTLLAKAIAGEADVPFFSISGSDFVEMFVGVGASRVRDLFKQAKDSSPCIIFLDEIDAVGRRRGGGFSHGGHDEREQTLNAILVEMDGFSTTDGVIVIAATNRSDVLDPALTRPGRFDRQIVVPRPDIVGRVEILKVHAKKVKLGPDVDLEKVARATPMFSGADLAALINEAAIAATLHNKDFIEQEDLEEARDKVRYGRARKSMHREKDDNRLTAYHEAGHAVLQSLLPDADPLHKVTIIPRGGSLGATFSLPEKDRMGYGLKWLRATMRVLCGGRIAEEKATQNICSGAAMDIAMVTDLARNMILEWGMSEKLGFIRYAPVDTREMQLPEKAYSDATAAMIDAEIRRMVDEAYAEAKKLIDENWDKVVAVAEALLKYETLGADEVKRLLRGETLGKPTVSDLLAAEARKEAQQNRPAPEPPPDIIPPGMIPRPA
ncbi:MAG: ATP-dependent zinc metalloprotease FtsH [Phycisphaerales bacterium]|nr:ATP-dependent zinc metalloprotease FtsH [Phycisphaerales bacterium]